MPDERRRVLVTITDTHLTADPDSAADLRAALAVVEAGARPDAIVLAGDLTADDPAAYRLLRDTVEPVAGRIDAAVVPVMGNHDERGAFRAAFGLPGGHDPCDAVHHLDGLRVAVLDTTVPGHHHGELTDAQLTRLAAALATPAPQGSVLVLHHPPLPSPVPSVDLLRLRGAERLAAAVDGTDVRMIVCGHAHYAGAGALAGIPVWIAPATAYRVDALPPAGRLRGVTGPALSRIDLVGGTAVATAVPLAGEPVYDVDAGERVAWMLARIPAEV
ncbi:metallophosphoesterase [Pseudonocardia nigra]|uniref:metallophosphoesterase n=1 Tax=Pseudonocardia nigra TaxID=1921578 RepID=UPI001C5EDF06|nr:metallophosphoesterase [Pseudonocardia nigra]